MASLGGLVRIPVNPKKQKQREAWHKVVVKVIRLRGGAKVLDQAEKLTEKEWRMYCSGILKSNLTQEKSVIKQNLKQIEATIKDSGGFAEL